MAKNNNNYNNSNNNNKKKHSGCTSQSYIPKEGTNKGVEMRITNGWMYRKQGGLTSFKCNTTGKSFETDNGWYGSVACEVINHSTMQKTFYWGMMEAKTGKVVIQDLGIVLNPRGGKGGYTGSFTK